MKTFAVLVISLYLFDVAFAQWAAWFVSQGCSASCGPGVMIRKRTCMGDPKACQGADQVAAPCVLTFCPDVFDCRRYGQSCANENQCDCTTGQCICPMNSYGYDCSVNSQNLSNGCTVRCLNGGFCVRTASGSPACFCDESYEGPSCNVKKQLLSADCSHHSMSVTYTPFKEFTGRMFVSGAEDDPTCFLKPQPSGEYTIAVPIESGCSFLEEKNLQMVPIENTDKETAQYTRMIIVQHHPDLLTTYDEAYRVTCIFSEGIVNLTATIQTQDTGALRQSRSSTALETMMDASKFVYAAFKNKAGVAVGGAERLRVGDMVHLEVGVTRNPVFKHVRVESCVIHPQNATSPALFVIKDGCSSNEYCGLVAKLSYITTSTGTAAWVPIRAFKFNYGHSEELVIRCQLRVCRNPLDCAPKSCGQGCQTEGFTAPADPPGRTRRQASDPSTTIVVMSDVQFPFIVWDPHTIESLEDAFVDDAVCYLIPVIILGILFGAAFLAACVTTVLVWRHIARAHQEEPSINYSNSSLHDAAFLCPHSQIDKHAMVI